MDTIRRHPLTLYAVLALLLSWWVAPLHVAGFPVFPFGPDVAAVAVVAATSGLPGVRRLLHQLREWRFGFRWYALVIAGPALIGWLAVVATHAIHPAGAPLPGPASVVEFLAVLPVMVLIGGALGEELGWRGYLLPELQRRHRPLIAVGLVAVVHLVWHLPLFAAPEGPDPVPFALELLGGGVVLAWLVNRTGLLWPAILAHSAHNMAQQAFMSGLTGSALEQVQWITSIMWLLLAATLVVATRGNLGAAFRGHLDADHFQRHLAHGGEQRLPAHAG
jgi:membrane protease YdiL (CAAX protease family)